MGQRVNAGIGRHSCRQAQGQFEIHQRRHGHEPLPDTQHFLVLVGIGDDGKAGHLRAGARSRRYGDDGQSLFTHVPGKLVVTHLPAKLAQNGNCLGRIDGAAASKGNQGVVIPCLHFLHPSQNRGLGRLRLGLRESVAVDARFPQTVHQPIHIAQLHHHRIGHDQRSATTQGGQDLRGLLTGASANFQQARQNDSIAHEFPPVLSVVVCQEWPRVLTDVVSVLQHHQNL